MSQVNSQRFEQPFALKRKPKGKDYSFSFSSKERLQFTCVEKWNKMELVLRFSKSAQRG